MMTAAPAAPIPRTRSRWRIIRRVLFLALLAVCAWFGWREYAFRAAVKEAQALGWTWEYDDPIDAIRKDWKAAFRKATWFEGKRELFIPNEVEFESHVRLLQRLAPKSMVVDGWHKFGDLSVFANVPSLRELFFDQCPALRNLDGLSGRSKLQMLTLKDCWGLEHVDGLKGLTTLEKLEIPECTDVKNFDALKGLTALQRLNLSSCTGLTNVDALKGLTALRKLVLSGCSGLTNVDALKGLTPLQELDLRNCHDIAPEAITSLQAALPNTKINPP